jgi:heterodisulfide reductase subunit A
MEMRMGVFICECGPNIADQIDIDRLLEEVTQLDGVAIAEKYKLLCSGDGKEYLKGKIKEGGLTHLVVAACSPKQHEITFMKVCEESGLNPYLFQMANIREQCAWVIEDKDAATQKALRHIKAAIRRVRYQTDLEKKELDANPDVMVIGGGIAGISASLLLASPERRVYLVEKTSSLGGRVKCFEKIFTCMEPTASFIDKKIEEVNGNGNIEVLTSSDIEYVLGFFGNFEVKVRVNHEEEKEFMVGAVVAASGFGTFDPTKTPQYGYGKFDDVITALEFEKMNASGKILLKNGKSPSSVAIVHCVGRKEKGYCSDVCCMYSLKFSRYLKEKLSDVKITHLYTDLCIPTKSFQKFYEQTKKKGVDFERATEVEVLEKSGGMAVKFKTGVGTENILPVDMVILASAIEPGPDSAKLAGILNIAQGETGFFIEEHEKIGPVSTSIEGVYIVGGAQGPKNVSDTIIQSEAATGKILSSLIIGKKIEPEVKVSEIVEVLCTGCKKCLTVCSYSAITFDEAKKVSVVNEAICRGCGNCAAACPSGAISLKGFTTKQLYQEIMEAVR